MHLTTYNKEHNERVKDHCIQDPKFDPQISCVSRENGQACKYLKIKRYK